MSLTVADTAYSIAAIRADETELFEDPYAKYFVAAGAHAEEGTRRYLALPFFREGIRLRTRFIDDGVRAALRDGIDQIVILGAGFDSRALRMKEIAEHARVFEIDLPEQMQRKREILERAGVAIPEWDVYVPFDFAKPDFESALPRDLEAHGFRMQHGAVFVWEGVIGYIDAAAIDASLRFMARAGAPRSRVVFTFAEGTFAPQTAAQHVRELGFATCEEHGLDEVWRRFLSTEPGPLGVSRVGICAT
jgi:methyltransferase (TIGR00027 family)